MLRAKFFLARSNFFAKCQSDSFIIITKAFWKSNQSKTILILVSQIVFDWCKENLLKHNDHCFWYKSINELNILALYWDWIFVWLNSTFMIEHYWLINKWMNHTQTQVQIVQSVILDHTIVVIIIIIWSMIMFLQMYPLTVSFAYHRVSVFRQSLTRALCAFIDSAIIIIIIIIMVI